MTAIADQPACRLYLTTPPELVSGGVALHDFLARFEPAADTADIACLLIAAPAEATDAAVAEIARPLIAAAQSRDIAALLSGRAELAHELGADGLHLDGAALESDALLRTYRWARKTLGDDAILGVLCPPERHAAMEIAEADAAYVGFAGPDLPELIEWWGELMTTPCVAFGSFTPESAGALAKAGADFIAPDATIWQDPDALSRLATAIKAGAIQAG